MKETSMTMLRRDDLVLLITTMK